MRGLAKVQGVSEIHAIFGKVKSRCNDCSILDCHRGKARKSPKRAGDIPGRYS